MARAQPAGEILKTINLPAPLLRGCGRWRGRRAIAPAAIHDDADAAITGEKLRVRLLIFRHLFVEAIAQEACGVCDQLRNRRRFASASCDGRARRAFDIMKLGFQRAQGRQIRLNHSVIRQRREIRRARIVEASWCFSIREG